MAIYTNRPDAIYIHTDIPAKWSPAAHGYNSSEQRKPVESVAATWPESSKAYLIWFDAIDRGHLFGVEELKQIADFKMVAQARRRHNL